jgi:hypothetical protein
MDPSNPDDWRKLATAFASAPVWAVIVATGVTVGAAVWWFRGWMSQEQIAAWDQRLKFADERVLSSERALEEVKKQVQDYKVEVATKGSDASSAKMDAAIEQLKRENALLAGDLEILQRELDYGDVGYYRTLERGGPGKGLEAMKKDQLMKKDKLVAALMSRENAKKVDLPRGKGYPDPNE